MFFKVKYKTNVMYGGLNKIGKTEKDSALYLPTSGCIAHNGICFLFGMGFTLLVTALYHGVICRSR